MVKFKEYLNSLAESVYSAKISSTKGFKNTYSGQGNNNAVVLVNDKGEFGFFDKDAKPYSPIGGRRTLVDLYKDSPQLFTFKPYDYGDGFTIKRGTKI